MKWNSSHGLWGHTQTCTTIMACAKLERGAVYRVRSEVNSLWRKAMPGDTMVNGGARVGGYPITFTICNAEPGGKIPTNSEELVKPHSLVMRSKVRDLMDEIDNLKRTVDELSQVVEAAGDTSTLVNMSRHRHVDSVLSQVALIKKQFHCIKEEGKKAYCDLERDEVELEKDVKALRVVVVSEEFRSSVEKSSGETKSVRRINGNEKYNKSCVKRNECKVSNLKGSGNTGTIRAASDKMSQGIKLNSMAYFRHSWDEKDHIQFVKVYQRHKLKDKRMQEWQRMFPYKTENDIINHASSYEAFIKEKEKVKNQIIQWKSEREQVKKELQERSMQGKLENENKVKLMNKAKEKRLKEEREERVNKLNKWKIRRKNEDSVDGKVAGVCVERDERKISVKSRHKKDGVKFTDKERANMATQLHLYRQQKEKQKQDAMQKKQEELQFKKLYSISNRKEFRKRDEQYINHKKEQKELQVRLKEEQTKRLERIKSGLQIRAESNKDRLFKPTLSHTAYKLSSQIKEKYNANVDQIPRLATPAWRQEI